MQNPHAQFGPGRPRLPGQEHPGLGMLYDVVAMLAVACERLHLDGLVFVPSEYHIAAYAKNRLAFFDPATRASFEQWTEEGSEDALTRANAVWKQRLSEYEQPPIDDAVAAELDDFVERRIAEGGAAPD